MKDQLRKESERGQSLLPLFYAPTIWAVHFCLSYAVAAMWCAKLGDGVGGLTLTLALITALALAGIALVAWRAWRQWDYTDDWDYVHDKSTDEDRREFLGHAGVLLAGVSAIGVIYAVLPAFLTGGCQ